MHHNDIASALQNAEYSANKKRDKAVEKAESDCFNEKMKAAEIAKKNCKKLGHILGKQKQSGGDEYCSTYRQCLVCETWVMADGREH